MPLYLKRQCDRTLGEEGVAGFSGAVRRAAEKRDFAWVPAAAAAATLAQGRTSLRAADGRAVPLLPRLGFALQGTLPAVLLALQRPPGPCARPGPAPLAGPRA